MRRGLFRFTIGGSAELVEWLYVGNLVHAHILAALKLVFKKKNTKKQKTSPLFFFRSFSVMRSGFFLLLLFLFLMLLFTINFCSFSFLFFFYKLDSKSHINGRAYFISDQKPINNFEFLRPLTTALGYSFPRISLPVHILIYVAWLVVRSVFFFFFGASFGIRVGTDFEKEIVHRFINPVFPFNPFLTRAELYKVRACR